MNIGNNKPVNLLDFIKILEKEIGLKAKINFMGMQIGDALYILESYGYDVNIISGFNGKVIKQELYDNDQVKTILLSVN